MVNSRPNVWQLQSQRDMQGLIRALHYPDPEVRGRAAVALRTLDAIPAVPALKAALHDELDEQTRKYLKQALHVLDQRTDVGLMVQQANLEGLVGALKSSRSETVIAAARALGNLGNRLAVEPLVIVFHNSTSPPAVRLAAAEALLKLKSAPAVVTLLGALRRDSWQVRRNAAAVLGQIQAIWAVEPLAEALHDSHPVVRRTAAAALKRIGSTEAITAMRDALRGQQSPMQGNDSVKRTSDQSKAHRRERETPREMSANDDQPTEGTSQVAEAPAPQSQFHFDSKPVGLESEGGKQSTAKPLPKRDDYLEMEKGKVGKSHVTHPSGATRPAVRIREASQQAREMVVEADSERDDAALETRQTEQMLSPIARLITFLRRRGSKR